MGELSESVPTDQSQVAEMSHRRLLIEMAVVVVAGCLILLAAGYFKFAQGFVFGGLLSFANYFWLRGSLRKLFERAPAGTSTAYLAMIYVLRYVLLAAIVYLVYLAGVFPVAAVVAGLASFVIAVLIEAFYNIFLTFNKKAI